jgi:hypothetical protein
LVIDHLPDHFVVLHGDRSLYFYCS